MLEKLKTLANTLSIRVLFLKLRPVTAEVASSSLVRSAIFPPKITENIEKL